MEVGRVAWGRCSPSRWEQGTGAGLELASPEAGPGERGSSRGGCMWGVWGGDSPDRAPAGSTAGGGVSLQPPEQGLGLRTWAAAGVSAGRGLFSASGEASGPSAVLCSRPQTQLGNLRSAGVHGAKLAPEHWGPLLPTVWLRRSPGPFGRQRYGDTVSTQQAHAEACGLVSFDVRTVKPSPVESETPNVPVTPTSSLCDPTCPPPSRRPLTRFPSARHLHLLDFGANGIVPCVLFRLASSTRQSRFETCPSRSMSPRSVPCWCRVVLHHTAARRFSVYSPARGHSGPFQFGAVTEQAAVSACEAVFIQTCAFFPRVHA
ncbi:uncharacterized protein LOC117795922 [Ailuropoda melanoleuca]|uniref:uncharacterized protein LOC117795922 n=1 Tax=Ailuropoda melanoleuca TaxID=9646 RepID=UPI0014944830|nr:uncharacterized protein LOC117795922 [Ailuropoda melanoleuca]